MNRFKCPACGGNQYTSCDTVQGCIYCGHQKLEKMDKLEPEVEEKWPNLSTSSSAGTVGSTGGAGSR